MLDLSVVEIRAFQTEILDWFGKNKRDLPWRRNRDPYSILVSEIMLQQTQVSRVIPKFEAWMTEFPTFQDLAAAKTSDVLALWSGLGYNRRALYLQKAARIVVQQYNGQFPNDVEELRSLPGLGEYTARAVACFAFDQQIAVVDTNIRKVIALKFFEGTPPSPKETQQIADQLLPIGRAYEWNQALMDYSAAVLSKEKIPIPKQSKFIGSNRYYRGQIIKLLVAEEEIAIMDLGPMLKSDFSVDNQEWLDKLVNELVKDNLVVRDGDKLRLP